MNTHAQVAKIRKLCREEFEALCFDHKACIREVLSPRREKRLVLQRRAIAVALRQSGYSYPVIGHVMNRDHSTIIHHVQKYEESLK